MRLAMTKPRKTAAPSGGELIPVAFFYGRLNRREAAARSFEQRSSRRMFQRVLCIAAAANTRPQCNLRHFSACFPEIHELPDDVALISRPSRPAKLRLGLSRTSEPERLSVKERKPISVLMCLLAYLFACKYVK